MYIFVDTGQKRRVNRRTPCTDEAGQESSHDATYTGDNIDVISYQDVEGNVLVDYCPSSSTSEPLFEADPRDALKVE